jgi:Ni/Fe-hydrogenase subunit HybB-like protein
MPKMISRTRTIKDILWFLALFGLVAGIFRLIFGLGATTNLSDMVPWGLWKVLNMVAGVALSTSGFTIGFLVYVLKLEKFRPFMKPAILIAFLGYGCSCLALLFDIGLPHRFWHPIFMWNINSFLFEVFWCVLLYFTVTAIELAPSFFDKLKAEKVSHFLHRIATVVVIIGISLSSLHHSSLGSLFLVTPQRLHALWYTPWLPVFFIISAMGGGLMLAIFVKIMWSWWYEREIVFGKADMRNIPLLKKANGIEKLTSHTEGDHFPMIRQLATIAAGILAIYLVLKIVDLFIQGSWGALLAGTWESWLYLFELAIASIIPVGLIVIPKTGRSPVIIGLAALSGVLGLALNRLDVGIFGYFSDAGVTYFPSLAEWAVCFGVIAAAGLVFFVIAENLQIFSENPPAVQSRAGMFRQTFGTLRQIWNMVFMNSLHRVSLIGVVTIPLAFALMYPPFFDNRNKGNLIKPSLGIDAERRILKIDGNRDGLQTVFAHFEHQHRLGDTLSCNTCHHVSMPNDKSTSCFECHRYMNSQTVIFNHDTHKSYITEKENLGGIYASNNSCAECHEPGQAKSSANAKDCLECHKQDMFLNNEPKEDISLLTANSFREAMHKTCIDCHTKSIVSTGNKMLDNCGTCHQDLKAGDTSKQDMVDIIKEYSKSVLNNN